MSGLNEAFLVSGLILVLCGGGLKFIAIAESMFKRREYALCIACIGAWCVCMGLLGLVGPGWLR